jgi:hypothetical protein
VVKSLLLFAARMGFTPFNIGAAIRPPRPDDRLAERILDERQVFALLDAVEGHPRDHALLRLLYSEWRAAGERSSNASVAQPRRRHCQRSRQGRPHAGGTALARDVGGAASASASRRLGRRPGLSDDGLERE